MVFTKHIKKKLKKYFCFLHKEQAFDLIKKMVMFFNRVFWKKKHIYILAFVVNFSIFYLFPVVYYLKGFEGPKTKVENKKVFVVEQIQKKEEEEKKRKLKVKKVQPKQVKPTRMDSRFKIKLSSGGSGVGIGSAEMKQVVFKANEVDKEARRISGSQPDYPSEAEESGITGYVEVKVIIDENGEIINAEVLQEQPDGFGFGDSALSAIYKWKYRPAENNNVPVKMEYIIPIPFK